MEKWTDSQRDDLNSIPLAIEKGWSPDFDYKDKFQNSTWLSLLDSRIELSVSMLNNSGSFYIHLDERADYLGRLLVENYLKFNREIIWDIQVFHLLHRRTGFFVGSSW